MARATLAAYFHLASFTLSLGLSQKQFFLRFRRDISAPDPPERRALAELLQELHDQRVHPLEMSHRGHVAQALNRAARLRRAAGPAGPLDAAGSCRHRRNRRPARGTSARATPSMRAIALSCSHWRARIRHRGRCRAHGNRCHRCQLLA